MNNNTSWITFTVKRDGKWWSYIYGFCYHCCMYVPAKVIPSSVLDHHNYPLFCDYHGKKGIHIKPTHRNIISHHNGVPTVIDKGWNHNEDYWNFIHTMNENNKLDI